MCGYLYICPGFGDYMLCFIKKIRRDGICFMNVKLGVGEGRAFEFSYSGIPSPLRNKAHEGIVQNLFRAWRWQLRFIIEHDLIGYRTALWKPSGMQGSPLVQRTTIGDIFDTTAIRNEPLLSNHVFKFICIELGETPFL